MNISKDILDWIEEDSDTERAYDMDNAPIQMSMLLSEPQMSEVQTKLNDGDELTQMEKVNHMFYIQRDVCQKDFMENYIPRFGALIWTLRHEENWVIDKERCDDDTHNHKSAQYKYVFKGVSND